MRETIFLGLFLCYTPLLFRRLSWCNLLRGYNRSAIKFYSVLKTNKTGKSGKSRFFLIKFNRFYSLSFNQSQQVFVVDRALGLFVFLRLTVFVHILRQYYKRTNFQPEVCRVAEYSEKKKRQRSRFWFIRRVSGNNLFNKTKG